MINLGRSPPRTYDLARRGYSRSRRSITPHSIIVMVKLLEYRETCPSPVVLRSIATFLYKPAEHAGRAYHERLHDRPHRATIRRTRFVSKPSLASAAASAPTDLDLTDFYALLRVPISASVDEIRRSYREVSLLYHPDKNPSAEQIYKAIQEAHSTLTDLRRRRVYDSSLPFDDSIPSEDTSRFFKEFGAAFTRNARFSEIQPVPLLGGPDSDFSEVDKFYDFWFGFKSWRDFSAECEHKPELAENRDDRRWMEKENQKVTNTLVKAEVARVRRLVDRAFRADPRVKAQRAAERAAKNAKKAQKNAGRLAELQRSEEAERERKAALARDAERQAAERRDGKKAAQDEKRRGRALRKGIREGLARGPFGELFERRGWIVDDLFPGLTSEDLEKWFADPADPVILAGHLRRVYGSVVDDIDAALGLSS